MRPRRITRKALGATRAFQRPASAPGVPWQRITAREHRNARRRTQRRRWSETLPRALNSNSAMAAAYVVRRNVTGPDREQPQVLVFRRRHQQHRFFYPPRLLTRGEDGDVGPIR